MEHEISWEPAGVAFYRLNKDPRLDLVELCQVRTEHDFLSADQEDPALNQLRWKRHF